MEEDVKKGADAPAPTTPTTADAEAKAKQERSDEPLRNLGEVVELRKEARAAAQGVKELKDLIAPLLGKLQTQSEEKKAEKPGDKPNVADAAMDEVKALRRELALERALLASGIADPKQRKLVELAAKAENPQDIAAFVAEYASTFPKLPETIVADSKPAATTDTGASGKDGRVTFPDDPFLIKTSDWKSMPREERQRRWQGRLNQEGLGGNPWARK